MSLDIRRTILVASQLPRKPLLQGVAISLFAEQIVGLFRTSGRALLALLPYVIVGVAVGELLKRAPWTSLLHHRLIRNPALTIPMATLLGMVSPLCTYGTVPVVLQGVRKGFPLAPLTTFLAVSSLMNPQLFLITWGGISPEMAMARAGSVLVFGLLLGFLLHRLPARWILNTKLNTNDAFDGKNQGSSPIASETFAANFWKSLQFVGFYIVVGILLGSFIEVFIPASWILSVLGTDSFRSVLFASLLGVPLYACGGGTVPLVRSLMQSGMSQGAAIAFFLVGPATRITPLMALAAVVRPRVLAVYIVLLIAYALLAGTIY